MIQDWKRVRVAQWTKDRDVRVKTITRRKDRWKHPGHQLLDNLLGVSVPIPNKLGVIVFPLEYWSKNQWFRVDPRDRYMIVNPRWLEELGDAHQEEIAAVKRGLVAHELEIEDREAALYRCMRESIKGEEID